MQALQLNSRPTPDSFGINMDRVLDVICAQQKGAPRPDVDPIEETITLLSLEKIGHWFLVQHPDERRQEMMKLCKRCVLSKLAPAGTIAPPHVCPRGRR